MMPSLTGSHGPRRTIAAASSVLVALAVTVSASSVRAPTFAQLVARAEIVFEGEVVDVRSSLVGSDGIVTEVTFAVRSVLKGTTAADTITLEFLGGTVGDRTLEVTGLPRFTRGDHDLLFAAPSEHGVSALVAFTYGRIRILRDPGTGEAFVARFDGSPIRDTLGAPSFDDRVLLSPTRAMSLDAFKARLRSEIDRQREVRR